MEIQLWIESFLITGLLMDNSYNNLHQTNMKMNKISRTIVQAQLQQQWQQVKILYKPHNKLKKENQIISD